MKLSIGDFNTQLHARFSELREVRGDQFPVYCIEHGLAPKQVSWLMKQVGAAVRDHGIGPWWKAQYLPLLVTATEIGYIYRGTGTDFWPKLESHIGASIWPEERPRLSDLFDAGRVEYGLKKPIDTRWTQAFHHIAWPIANAIVPREIQADLVATLRRHFETWSTEDPKLDRNSRLRNIARSRWSLRLFDWLSDSLTSTEVVQYLLDERGEDSWLTGEILERIKKDLYSEKLAKRNLRQARKIAGGAPPRIRLGPAVLHISALDSGAPSLSVAGPRLDEIYRDRLQKMLARAGFELRIWGKSEPVDSEHFFTGNLVPVPKLDNISEVDAEFLPALSAINLGAGIDSRIRSIAPVTDPPLLFHVPPGEVAGWQVLDHSGLDDQKEHVVLCQSPPKGGVPGLETLGEVAGLCCVKVSPDVPEGRRWMEKAGYEFAASISLDLVGGIPLGQGPHGPVFAAGARVLLAPTGVVKADLDLTVRLPGQDVTINLDEENPVAIINAPIGDHSLEVLTGHLRRQVRFSIVRPEPRSGLFEIRLDPPEPTADDLLRGVISIQIRSHIPVEDHDIELELTCSGTRLGRCTHRIERVPCLLGPESTPLIDLREAVMSFTFRTGAPLILTARLPGLFDMRFTLGWEPDTCVWERIDNHWVATDAGQTLPAVSVPAAAPFSNPASYPVETDKSATIIAWPDTGPNPAGHRGFCIGPPRLRLAEASSALQIATHRKLLSSGNTIGLIPCIEEYLRWCGAISENLVVDFSRKATAQALERAAVEILCGHVWVQYEKQLPLTPGDLWESLADIALEGDLASGEYFPEIDDDYHSRLRQLLVFRMRMARPGLWDVDPGSGEIDNTAEQLDTAINDAYDDLRSDYERDGRIPFEDVDAGNASEDWVAAIHAARSRIELNTFSQLILPRTKWEILSRARYSDLLEEDVTDLLQEVHVDLQPRASQRWLNRENIQTVFHLWVSPGKVPFPADWQETAEHLLADRQSARAIRYAALRFRRSGTRTIVNSTNSDA